MKPRAPVGMWSGDAPSSRSRRPLEGPLHLFPIRASDLVKADSGRNAAQARRIRRSKYPSPGASSNSRRAFDQVHTRTGLSTLAEPKTAWESPYLRGTGYALPAAPNAAPPNRTPARPHREDRTQCRTTEINRQAQRGETMGLLDPLLPPIVPPIPGVLHWLGKLPEGVAAILTREPDRPGEQPYTPPHVGPPPVAHEPPPLEP